MPFVNKARRIDPNLRKTNIGLTKREKEIYTIYSNAFNSVRNQLGDQKVLRDILDALKMNSASGVNNAINWRTFLESLSNTAPTLAQQIAEVANLHSKVLPKKLRYEYNFEAKDPRAIAWAQTQAGKRIQGITIETQQAVANMIADGLRTKLTREEIIAQLRQTVGLDKRQSKALGNFYMKRLEKYLEDGLTYEEAAKKAEKDGVRYRTRLVKQRAIRIARTEISAAANAGRYLSWEEADARGLLPPDSKKRWLTNIDERTCPVCQPMNGTLIAWEATFSTGDIMPPAHPNCRCTSVIVPGEIQVIKSIEKHAPGKHNQQSHAGGRGGKSFNNLQDFLADEDLKWADKAPYAREKYISDMLYSQMNGADYIAQAHSGAIAQYQSNGGKKINEALRDPQISDEGYRKQINSLDAAIEEAPALKEPMEVFRGVTKNVDRDNEFWSKMEVGDVFEDKGFVSTSLSPKVAADFAYAFQSEAAQGFVFRLKLPTGTKGLFPVSVRGADAISGKEAEFLLPRGSKFELLSKEGKVWELGLVND